MAIANAPKRNFDKAPLIAALQALLGDRCSLNAGILDRHGHDESYHEAHAPDVVVFPQSTEEVAAVMRLARKHGAPVIPFGVGTSLEGHVAALEGGVSIDMGRMNRVVEVNADDLDVLVEAGVTRKQLNAHLRDQGLFFPIDPGADATIGGMSATRASGTNAVRYGTMRENVLGLTVVTADGRVMKVGGRARKSAAGYDLTRLFVGSEGTLGVITEVRLRLYGIPEAMAAAVTPFPTIGDAVDTVIRVIQSGIPVARIELLDESQMRPSTLFQARLRRAADLVHRVPRHRARRRGAGELVKAIAGEHGGGDFRWSVKPEERASCGRRGTTPITPAGVAPGRRAGRPMSACRSRACRMHRRDQGDIEASGLLATDRRPCRRRQLPHLDPVDPNDPGRARRREAFNDRLVERALKMGGTCTGEHGIGFGKIGYLEREHGEAVGLMRLIKQTLDPENRMNPGKIFRA
jgi:D-lactate dehydrogenase (cytochrome)